jgi:flap endonuclease-1
MGIHNLMKLLGDFAPGAVKECEIKNYFGRKGGLGDQADDLTQ